MKNIIKKPSGGFTRANFRKKGLGGFTHTNFRKKGLGGFTRANFRKKGLGGFTIIEVIIVLAIAGLIMVIVFLAVPQLQRNARDQSRRSIVSRIKSEIETYAANNQSTYPFKTSDGCPGGSGDWCDLYTRYLSTIDIKDPSLGANVITGTPATAASTDQSYVAAFTSSNMSLAGSKGLLNIVTKAKCDGESVKNSPGSNSYAILIGLDRAGTRYCVDNG